MGEGLMTHPTDREINSPQILKKTRRISKALGMQTGGYKS